MRKDGTFDMICPACGFNYFNKDINSKIKIALEDYDKQTIKTLRNVANKIILNIPSENSSKFYAFLYGLKYKLAKEEAIKYGISKYLDNDYHLKVKGFAYLKAIILNLSDNYDNMKKAERKMYGVSPKYITIEEEL